MPGLPVFGTGLGGFDDDADAEALDASVVGGGGGCTDSCGAAIEGSAGAELAIGEAALERVVGSLSEDAKNIAVASAAAPTPATSSAATMIRLRPPCASCAVVPHPSAVGGRVTLSRSRSAGASPRVTGTEFGGGTLRSRESVSAEAGGAHGSSQAAISWTVCGRAPGSFSRQRRMHASISGGMPALRCEGGIGESLTIIADNAGRLSAQKGGAPVQSS